MMTYRFSGESFASKGSSKFSAGVELLSTFRYILTDGGAGVLSHFTGFSRTLVSFIAAKSLSASRVLLFSASPK